MCGQFRQHLVYSPRVDAWKGPDETTSGSDSGSRVPMSWTLEFLFGLVLAPWENFSLHLFSELTLGFTTRTNPTTTVYERKMGQSVGLGVCGGATNAFCEVRTIVVDWKRNLACPGEIAELLQICKSLSDPEGALHGANAGGEIEQ